MRLKPPHLALALAIAAVVALPLVAGETKEKASAPAAGAAMKIYVDPATGQIVPTPVPGTKAALTPSTAVARPELKVEDVKARAGGKRVHLDDRFMMEMTATVTPDSKISYSCKEEGPRVAAPAKEDRHDR